MTSITKSNSVLLRLKNYDSETEISLDSFYALIEKTGMNKNKVLHLALSRLRDSYLASEAENRTAASRTNERITTDVSLEIKELLEKTVSLSGYASLDSFIASAAVAEAKRLIEQNMRIQLCQDDVLSFVNALERPVKTNERFLRAARKHKEKIRDEGSSSR